MKISYRIDNVKRVIFEIWPKEITIEDYIKVKEKEFSDPNFDKGYSVITDLRNVEMNFDEKIILEIVEFMTNYSNQMENRKSAVVADSPQLVASSIFFGNKNLKSSVKVSVFSSMSAALKWIHEKW